MVCSSAPLPPTAPRSWRRALVSHSWPRRPPGGPTSLCPSPQPVGRPPAPPSPPTHLSRTIPFSVPLSPFCPPRPPPPPLPRHPSTVPPPSIPSHTARPVSRPLFLVAMVSVQIYRHSYCRCWLRCVEFTDQNLKKRVLDS